MGESRVAYCVEVSTAANPLRRGERVTCPACGHEFEAWRRALVRAERYREHTTAVYKCPNHDCRFVFALVE